jgi:hypothetical protein
MYPYYPSLSLLKTFGPRLWLSLCWSEFKSEVCRATLCKLGYHSVYSSGERWTLNNKEMVLQTHYLGCRNCEQLFFSTQYQKEMYLRIREHDKAMWANLVKSTVESIKNKDEQKVAELTQAMSEIANKPERKPKCDVLEKEGDE